MILLRKMTEKSTMNFGKYSELTVRQVIDINTSYIVWSYYNSSKITFVDELLDEINISAEHRIEKPGTCAETHQLHLERIWSTRRLLKDATPQENMQRKIKKASYKDANYKRVRSHNNANSKRGNWLRNQGKIQR